MLSSLIMFPPSVPFKHTLTHTFRQRSWWRPCRTWRMLHQVTQRFVRRSPRCHRKSRTFPCWRKSLVRPESSAWSENTFPYDYFVDIFPAWICSYLIFPHCGNMLLNFINLLLFTLLSCSCEISVSSGTISVEFFTVCGEDCQMDFKMK